MDSLRQVNYGGYLDWRLPVLEEAMSRMEPQRYDDLYIDPKFDGKQRWIWTADKDSAGRAWYVIFYGGYCYHFDVGKYYFVRAVRSGQ